MDWKDSRVMGTRMKMIFKKRQNRLITKLLFTQ